MAAVIAARRHSSTSPCQTSAVRSLRGGPLKARVPRSVRCRRGTASQRPLDRPLRTDSGIERRMIAADARSAGAGCGTRLRVRETSDRAPGRLDNGRICFNEGPPTATRPCRSDDPITFELFRNAIFAIADEMALTVFRTTYSGVLKDNMDYSTAFCDANGKLVAQGLTLPGHLGSIPTALDAVVAKFGGDIHPGDIFIMNDPFEGGMHLPDIFLFKPLFHDGETARVRRHDLPPHRRRRPGRGLQRLGLDRDLPGRPAHPAAQALRRGRAQRDPVRADREERPRAGQAVRRPARPARRLPHRRAPVREPGRALRRRRASPS